MSPSVCLSVVMSFGRTFQDHEDQPIINAKNVQAACPDLCFDWKGHLQKIRSSRKGGLLSFVQVSTRNAKPQEEVGFDQGEAGGIGKKEAKPELIETGDHRHKNSRNDLDGKSRSAEGGLCASELRMKAVMTTPPAKSNLLGSGDAVRGMCASEVRMMEVIKHPLQDHVKEVKPSPPKSVEAGAAVRLCASEKRMREIANSDGVSANAGGKPGKGEANVRKKCGSHKTANSPGGAASGGSGAGRGAGILQFFEKK